LSREEKRRRLRGELNEESESKLFMDNVFIVQREFHMPYEVVMREPAMRFLARLDFLKRQNDMIDEQLHKRR